MPDVSHKILHHEVHEMETGFKVSRDPKIACLDADKLVEPLTLRRWQSGDKFIPFGMNGFKKYVITCVTVNSPYSKKTTNVWYVRETILYGWLMNGLTIAFG